MGNAREYATAVPPSALFEAIVFLPAGYIHRDYIELKIQECGSSKQ